MIKSNSGLFVTTASRSQDSLYSRIRPRLTPVGGAVLLAVLHSAVCFAQGTVTTLATLEPSNASRMVADESGITYLAVQGNGGSGDTLVGIDAKGVVRFRTAAPPVSGIVDIAPVSPSGAILAQRTQISGVDSSGKVAYTKDLQAQKLVIGAVTTDKLGNIYVAGSGDGIVILKLDSSGQLLKSFTTPGVATPTRVVVDAAGAIYVSGSAPVGPGIKGFTPFATTPGAFMETNPSSSLNTDGWVMKVSRELDRVLYATLLGGAGSDQVNFIAVDSSGDLFAVGVDVANGGTITALDAALRPIGLPAPGTFAGSRGYVVKLDPSGSQALFAVSLCNLCEIKSLLLPSEGGVQALAQPGSLASPVLFTIDSTSGQMAGSQPFFELNRASDLARGTNGVSRVLGARGFIPNASPVVLDIATAPYHQVDVEISATFPFPPIRLSPRSVFRVTVVNHGPDAAEQIEVRIPYNLSIALDCIRSSVAACVPSSLTSAGTAARIPKLGADEQVTVDFSYSNLGAVTPITLPILVSSAGLDLNPANNYVELTEAPVAGTPVTLQQIPAGPPFEIVRSDLGPCGGSMCLTQKTSREQLTVYVPGPQRWQQTWWYFDSWGDGSTENPRTFEVGSGLLPPRSAFKMRGTGSIATSPSSWDFVVEAGQVSGRTTIGLNAIYDSRDTVVSPVPAWLKDVQLTRNSATALSGIADASGMSAGFYTDTVTVALGDPAAGVSVTVPVTLRVVDGPPTITGIVDAANNRADAFAGFQIVTIFGTGLGPSELLAAPIPVAGELPYYLGGTAVEINDIQLLPLLYVQANQVAAILPSLNIGSTLHIKVHTGSTLAATKNVGPIQSRAPNLFAANGSGTGNLAAMNEDGSINSPNNPAQRGTFVTLYGEGLVGSFDFCGPGVGESATPLKIQVEVEVGGRPADVFYAGSAPSLPCIQQLNVKIPEDAPTGAFVPVRLRADYIYTTQEGVGISVRQ